MKLFGTPHVLRADVFSHTVCHHEQDMPGTVQEHLMSNMCLVSLYNLRWCIKTTQTRCLTNPSHLHTTFHYYENSKS